MSGFVSDYDRYLLQEGTHLRAYEKLGAHLVTLEGRTGVHFAVWAPNASRAAVIGDFNGWNDTAHPLQPVSDSGIWAGFVEGIGQGALYKYALHDKGGHRLPDKADPFAFYAEIPPRTASIVWSLPEKTKPYLPAQGLRDPVSIYEVHLSSWRRGEGNRMLTYRELAEQLIPYAAGMGFTHLELLPIAEHPFNGSWGYQPIGLYAPTSRFGTPDDFHAFIEQAHEAGLMVLIDWVPGHFPSDAYGLAQFDGTPLYEHADPREGRHKDWDTLVYNYGRTEVGNFLLSNAYYWLECFGIDGLRVDAVASMLYRNYGREPGEWIPNRYGGIENLEAADFLKRMNSIVFHDFPQATTAAEESTAWPGVSRPVDTGGLGFGYKWNMGWMHDTLDYMSRDPIHRRHHHHQMTFGMLYAYSENFILPLSHDEVVYGKRSLLDKMPGDEWQKFANLRAYYGWFFAHPGKKLLFMGGEFAQGREWQHDYSLDWHLLEDGYGKHQLHRGVQALVRDLNRLYHATPALHRYDYEPRGFEWLQADAVSESVYAFLRRGEDDQDIMVIVSNFTPVLRESYRIGVPLPGFYEEKLNTDSSLYGGSDMGNKGGVHSTEVPHDARPYSLVLTLPPLATVFLSYRKE